MYYLELFMSYGVLTAVVLTFVIFIHEMGHYLMARAFGVKVEAFSIGFGRELLGRTDRRGMRWRICLFPIGGYVVMRGELPPFKDADQSFQEEYAAGSLWTRTNRQRALVAFAGPLANFIFAFVLMIGVYFFAGKDVANPFIGALEIGAGAEKAGLLVGDRLIEIDGQPVAESFEDIVKQTQNGGDPLSVVIDRGGKELSFQVSLSDLKEEGDFGEKTSRKVMGVVLGSGSWALEAIETVDTVPTHHDIDTARALLLSKLGQETVVLFGLIKKETDVQKNYRIYLSPDLNKGLTDPQSYYYSSVFYGNDPNVRRKPLPFFQSISASFEFCGKVIKKTVGVLYQIGNGTKDSGDLGGVVKIGEMTGAAARQTEHLGMSIYFKILVVLSMNIGFLNLLPLPMLDGGHLSFNLYEALRGKAPSPKTRAYIMVSSVGFVLAFVIFVNIRDVFEILS